MKRAGLSRRAAALAATVLLLSAEGASAEGLRAQHATYILSLGPNSGNSSVTGADGLMVYDLKSLRHNKNVPDTIRKVAAKLYTEKAMRGGKN